MSSVSKEQIELAKQMDLLTYLQRYEPDELVPNGSNEFTTQGHSSLVISHGKWIWNKHGIGGRSALDYLIKVRDMTFVDAVRYLNDRILLTPLSVGDSRASPPTPVDSKTEFSLPPQHERTTKVEAYLEWRGIDAKIIWECIAAGNLYENKKECGGKSYYNCVFVGKDTEGVPRYAMLRGAFSSFRGEAKGSDKAYAFKYHPKGYSDETRLLYVCESAIDVMSLASLHRRDASAVWRCACYLSLGGTSSVALLQFLKNNPQFGHVCLALDNDEAGRAATDSITRELAAMGVTASDVPAPYGKDYNQYLKSTKEKLKNKTKSSLER